MARRLPARGWRSRDRSPAPGLSSRATGARETD
nr:MAG TPA: hypothetical protein [Caudoviricetes sp.]